MDQVDRSILKSVDSEALHLHLQCHANLAAAEHDKLTSSTSCSGSLIITDCGEELSRSSGTFEKNVPKVPTGLKVIALLSMTTAIILIAASGILLAKTHETLVKWLKAAPTTMPLLDQVNKLLGGTTGIVEEVQSQEKYLKILITCSAVLVVTGMIQLLCNIWFFCRMNATCIRRCLVRSEQFFCGL
ncbi:uncharacterized protein LOC110848538 [Folsomia candida]|uniref:Uncharacterized protein n=1 Tax=Folsomia candida TaxID=158441 RepID=A0A226EIT2_FOLCA|nr:uncharacterized protein LOC110848538 [Folsomia candida]OXA56661.1 hypothetical protein Fcan01_09559 [Folsomia candida]